MNDRLIVAIVVTYQPDLETLERLLGALVPQVASVVMVDNGSSIDLTGFSKQNNLTVAEVLCMGENRGIAAAQNAGIQWARDRGAEFVLLMDQDSIPNPEMVSQLLVTYDGLVAKEIRVAAVGPRYRDNDNGTLSPFVRVGFLGFKLLECLDGSSHVEADFLISSGALLPLSAIDAIGQMDESLFIDHVDTEWCFRAKAHGFRLFGVCDALMNHTLGERRQEIWFMRQRTISYHKPFRYYYIYRNSILLYRRKYMPWSWKLADMARCLNMTVFFGLAADNRFDCLRMMGAGLIDGLKGVGGKHIVRAINHDSE